jgi:RNA polymerase sigma-70 factor (ECF subfamily)
MAASVGIHRFVASVFSIGRTAREAPSLSFEQVHEQHADFVWRSLQRLGVRDSDLEDALQDVFLVVHRKLDTFDGSARLTTWLYGIALRVAAAHRRRAHIRREEMTPDLESTESTAADDPEAALLESESRRRLESVLDSMSLEKRAVFVMFEIEGLTAVEIAEIVGVPVGTVHSRLYAARGEFARAAERWARRDRFGGAP